MGPRRLHGLEQGLGLESRIELWAGLECSVVRIGDRYIDQNEATGHAHRIDDLDLLASSGVRAVRYPVLWERTAPGRLDQADFRWADERLERLRELGLRPIVGLVHHGSGPRHTSLLDPTFPQSLAAYARCVAERYPWVEAYTPLNEIVTTARFSTLYGHWYPHVRDPASFFRALLIECSATRAAMQAVREVNPRARLVQTEDGGKTFSTRPLSYEARFQNQRQFLGFDLLTGRVGRRHTLRSVMLSHGVGELEIESFAEDPCPPDVIGLNYYLTSDRFLDHCVDAYPEEFRSSNERDRFADVEALSVRAQGMAGHADVLRRYWRRYRLPVALTEVHLGATGDAQVQWLVEAWKAAHEVAREGADVCAVTIWSAFGSLDWDSLLMKDRGHFEPGMFDVRGGRVRPTALVDVARELSASGTSVHPALADVGWWRKPTRLKYPTRGRVVGLSRSHAEGVRPTIRREIG